MENGFICGFDFDGTGAAFELDASALHSPIADGHWRWLHLERTEKGTSDWLYQESLLPEIVIETLLAVETRPRLQVIGDGAVLILRGVNLNPQADPEDMIAIRTSIEPNRIITSRHTKLMAIDELRHKFAGGDGPKDIGDFVVSLNEELIDRMGPIVAELNEEADELEDYGLDPDTTDLREELSELRHKLIPLRRYLKPQQDVLLNLISTPLSWIEDQHIMQLRDLLDQLTRYIEDLDAAKDRANVVQDWLSAHLSDQTNRTMLLISVVTSVFLPLTLISGILGMNVNGIPLATSPYAFFTVVGGMVVMALILLWLFRRNKII